MVSITKLIALVLAIGGTVYLLNPEFWYVQSPWTWNSNTTLSTVLQTSFTTGIVLSIVASSVAYLLKRESHWILRQPQEDTPGSQEKKEAKAMKGEKTDITRKMTITCEHCNYMKDESLFSTMPIRNKDDGKYYLYYLCPKCMRPFGKPSDLDFDLKPNPDTIAKARKALRDRVGQARQ